MKAKNQMILLLGLFVILVYTGITYAQEEAGKVFEKALYLEESEGDLQKAISLYEKIVKEYSKELEIAAKAQLHIGFCYEKLGKAEAIKAYELVVQKYSSQKEQVATALLRLDELKKEPPKDLSVVKLGGWEKPGMAFQPYEISPDGKMGIGIEFMKGQNIIVYNLETKDVKFITNHTWDVVNGYCWTYHPTLSPNGKEIVYYSSCVDKEGAAGNSLTVTTLGGESRILASDKEEYYIPNAWLPDGSAILTIKGSPDNAPQLGFYSKDGGDFKTLLTLQKVKQGVGRSYATASISPDGRYILYTDEVPGEKADIYIVGTDGENPRPLVSHPASEKYPRWSPDGKNIVFFSQRHGSWALWGVDFQDGDVLGEPFLIRDGMKNSYLLNWTENGLATWDWVRISDIYLMDIDPVTDEPVSKPTQLEYTPTGHNGTPVWSPDGKSFAFLRGNPNIGGVSIIVVGSNTREFTVPKDYGYGYLRWTPDNSAIGMVGADKQGKWFLYRLSLDPEKWETTPIKVEEWTQFEWSGSGNSIFLSKTGYADKGAGIVELDLETEKERYVYRPNQDTGAVFIRQLKCSRDFKQLTFLENNSNLMVVNLETGESHIAALDVGYASWSSDGKKMLTDGTYAQENSKQCMFICPASGGPVKKIDLSQNLPVKSSIRVPDWSPDGKKIVFTLRTDVINVTLFRNIIPTVK